MRLFIAICFCAALLILACGQNQAEARVSKLKISKPLSATAFREPEVSFRSHRFKVSNPANPTRVERENSPGRPRSNRPLSARTESTTDAKN